MIKFFRHIRRALLAENKFSKYLLYAIGELVLVVFGILLALQINTWNEEKKLKQEQQTFLKNLKNELQNDSKQLAEIIALQQKKLAYVEALKKELVSDNHFDAIEKLFAKIQATSNNTFFPNTGTYTTAVSSGMIAKLPSDSLKIAITNLYERYYYRLVYNGEIYDKRNDEVALERGKFYNKFTEKLNSKDVIYESEFVNLISIIIYDNTTYIRMGTTTNKEIEQVLKQIDTILTAND